MTDEQRLWSYAKGISEARKAKARANQMMTEALTEYGQIEDRDMFIKGKEVWKEASEAEEMAINLIVALMELRSYC